MRRLTWIAPVAVLVMAGCADTGGEAAESGTPAATDTVARAAASEGVLTMPACDPAEDRMPLAGRPSPYDSATIRVGDGVAKICYGRPSLKGRTMIGGDAVPYDTLWRTGANEPTTVHLNVPATIGDLEVQPGAYSLYTVPRADGPWTLVVNRSTSQWGHESQYTAGVRAEELGRTEVEAETLDSPVEQLTIRPAGSGEPGALLEWQNTRVHIPIEPAG